MYLFKHICAIRNGNKYFCLVKCIAVANVFFGTCFHHEIDINFSHIFLPTGADDSLRQDFAKELTNAMAGMPPDSFELFPADADEALKMGLDPLDLDGLQMLTDPNMVADPATEDSFRLDRL